MSTLHYTHLLQPHRLDLLKGYLVAVDPGETTGIAAFKDGEPFLWDQLATGEATLGVQKIWSWITQHTSVDELRWLVVEEYRIYSWKAKQHSWSNLHTARLIGGLDVVSAQKAQYCTRIKQSAQQAKGFVTDTKLKAWNLYIPGKRHARDALRHGLHFCLFSTELRA